MSRTARSVLASCLITAVVVGLGSALASADVKPVAGMLRYPDIGRDKIVFSYANDLWVVDREGGEAAPLASPPGGELFPKFSADGGAPIAFVGNYDGGRDVYTIPVAGGVPVRVTHHPASETLCDWTPDGGLLFYSNGASGLGRMTKLFTVESAGGLPETLPVPYGAAGAISPDGTWLAYTPHTRDGRTWKRYRGGMATDLWLFNLKTHESRQVTDWEGTDTLPMWHGKKLYYLSDRGEEHKLNIRSYDPKTRKHTQVTSFSSYDVKWPSIGPGDRGQGEIIFQNGSALYVYDLNLGAAREVKVTIPGARPTIRTRRVNVSNSITEWNISPTGKRAVVEARGDIWTLPAENGPPRNLTRTSGAAERSPSWSPDGRWIAYFSDESGEYELYITQSDGKGETRQLTSGTETFYLGSAWSPDSKHIAFIDKAQQMLLHNIETGETTLVDKDPWGNTPTGSWSHDSRWIAYARSGDEMPNSAVWLYEVETGEKTKVTSGRFADQWPVFDRAGNHLYFSSVRHFSPSYSNVDSTFIYDDSQVLIAVPLRADVEAPWQLESDEEEWKEEEKAEDDEEKEDEGAEEGEGDKEGDEDASGGDDEGAADDADDEGAGDDDESDEDAAPTSPIEGVWSGSVSGLSAMGLPPEMDSVEFTMTIVVADDGTISGTSEAMGQSDDFDEITFDEASGLFTAKSVEEGMTTIMRGTLEGDTLTGTWEVLEAGASGSWTAKRTSTDVGDAKEAAAKADKAAEKVEIDLDGFEARAMLLPVPNGNFGRLAVNDKNQLLYVRMSESGPGVKLFDLKDDKKTEKNVAAGVFDFEISADGKKILTVGMGGGKIQNAAAGGSGKAVPTTGMVASIDPREEWRQILIDAWRIQRDFFYVDNLHGVDWAAKRDQYLAMLDDCVTREDVSYVIRELISELNVGHAYYFGGDVEGQSFVSVGLLGVDYELHDGAFRIARIHEGGPWDVDARNPLREAGSDVKEGEYLLAVNGIPMDTAMDPWAAFIGLANRPTMITVSEHPVHDENAREVMVRPIGSEGNLRYRGWIERNRAYVDEKTDGQVGYIYVPDTGVNGQNNLVRQYFGQIDKKALIIDERWNGGGQIPTRFIEMLNRPITNYWARRDNKDWKWPPDAQHGPKCMLINGLAGSGGDMFPWLFKYNDLGKLIGTRTWGGLVGISGNPGLIDGGYTAVPTFGFYEKDGTWGIEGHGVEPDIEVVDDPALMVDGGDPQLDAGIELMLAEIEANPYTPPTRPKAPDRSGMGVAEEDK